MLNPYFNNYNNRREQLLYESLIIEAIQSKGVKVIYLPRESVIRDKIFGEDIIAKYQASFQIEAYMETIEGFDGEGYLASNLGIQINDTTIFTISKRRFLETIKNRTKPLEGDLIYFPLSDSLFEINKVSNKSPFFQLGRQHIFKLDCELYTYSHEDFDTKHSNIDNIMSEHNDINNILNADNIPIEQEGSKLVIENSTPDIIINRFDPNNPFGED